MRPDRSQVADDQSACGVVRDQLFAAVFGGEDPGGDEDDVSEFGVGHGAEFAEVQFGFDGGGVY